jgi:hypothetical protein
MGVPCFWPAFVTAKKWRQTKFARNSRKNQKTRPKNGIISNFTVFCEEISELPVVASFENLNITDNFASAVKSLRGLAGIYAIKCTITGAIYLGSAVDLGKRMREHFLNSSNIHLRNAISHYGIASFVFIVIEFIEVISGTPASKIRALLLSREQVYLDWLFSTYPKSLIYNFLATAGSALGLKLTQEQRLKLSAAMKGKNTGENNSNYGKIAHTAVGVSVYTLDNKFVQSFSSNTAAAKFLCVSQPTLSVAIKRGYVIKGSYKVVKT